MVEFHILKRWGVVGLGIVEVLAIPSVISNMDADVDKYITAGIAFGVLLLLGFIVFRGDNRTSIDIKKITSNIATLNESIEREKEELIITRDPAAIAAHERSIKLLEEQKTELENRLLQEVKD